MSPPASATPKTNRYCIVHYNLPSFKKMIVTITNSFRFTGKTDKPGGPPVQRLFSLPGGSAPSTPADMGYAPSTPQASFNLGTVADQSDQFEDSEAGTWVTVFGFPPSAASYILTQAGMWGHILEHKAPSQVEIRFVL